MHSSAVSADILIIREGDAYRLLHGHLRLISMLLRSGEVDIEIKEEGMVKITKTRNGYVVGRGEQQLPLYGDNRGE